MNEGPTKRRWFRFSLRTLLIVVIPMIISCDFSGKHFLDNYKRAVQSGFDKIPEALEVEKLFGEADHSISNSPGAKVPNDWYTEVFIAGRYQLTLEVPVRVNSSFNEITEVIGEPHFYLDEFERIEKLPDGRYTSFGASRHELTKAQWKRLVDNNGDFSAIDIKLDLNHPLKLINEYKALLSEPHVKVRPKVQDKNK